jgi:hypothetical protein
MAREGSEGAVGAGRGLVFALVLVAIIIGPAHLRWLGGARPSLDSWSMYHDLGVGMVDARFVRRDRPGSGAELELDPRVVLRSELRPVSRKLRGLAEVEGLGRRLCAALGPDADVRAYARVATQAGWQVVMRGDRPLCAARGAR